MTTQEIKLNKLKEFAKALEESLTRDEFLEAFKQVLEIVKRTEAKNIETINLIIGKFEQLKTKLETQREEALSKAKRVVAAELESLLRRFSQEQKKIDDKLAQLKDGISPDKAELVADVLTQIKLPEYKEFILTAEDVRNKLELLKGKERLDVKSIDGLEDLFEALNKKIKGEKMMGGLRPAPTGVETPAGIQNETNKTFTVLWKPQFITINGQSVYQDYGYTLGSTAGVLTITLDNAPASDEILRSHY